MVAVRIATFNANNLFSRWSFQAELPRTVAHLPRAEIAAEAPDAVSAQGSGQPSVVEVVLPDGTRMSGVLRTFRGKLVKGKDPKAREWIARRIAALNADVLCLQEVEDQDALDTFHRDDLRPLGVDYRYRVVVEGNDPRRIDVAICSRLPITRISSWRYWPDRTGEPVFGRDLLQAQITTPDGTALHVFVNHLKSNFIADEHTLTPAEITAARHAINRRRTEQATAITQILRRQRLTRRIVITGDLNDTPHAATLTPLRQANLTEQIHQGTTTAGPDRNGHLIDDAFTDLSPTIWTHRHRAKGITTFALYDQIWTSPDLTVTTAHVMRRTQISGDGSDHDPAYIDLALA
ncbi:Metal-dependent hydrolase, endonuclease/exonuclease/phosphatase family [Micromonospora coxensis]|uniref:Metal-dependent hydrolase, endonuclease/exonuclease/phosphatase family n=1 Tax=Micromonospora coxensis TaxID=356852 RepID=A0A1C5GX93_9ACTN|nr:Metal-dependent hydrolase, endonuclease/exonuclease/phosphatase family [Micromonospora coxensis]